MGLVVLPGPPVGP
uniref:Uncharacterized protein n=1 Tax=Rhizophora mucronata TaxID=61149 RepID=A0A2P2NWJ0_RHIMU